MTLGWEGSYERKGELFFGGGGAVLGLAPLKEPLSVEQGSLRNHRRNIQAVDGMAMIKHPIYQDVRCWRAVN